MTARTAISSRPADKAVYDHIITRTQPLVGNRPAKDKAFGSSI